MIASFDFNNINGLTLVNIDIQDGKTNPLCFKTFRKNMEDGKKFWLFKTKQIMHKELCAYLTHRKLAYQYAGCVNTDKILVLERCKIKLDLSLRRDNYQFFIDVYKMRNNLVMLKPVKVNYWNEKIDDLLAFTENILKHAK